MTKLNLQSVVYREGKHYVAQCLNIDVSSFGDTETEALANLQEALELYFEDAPAAPSARSCANPGWTRAPLGAASLRTAE